MFRGTACSPGSRLYAHTTCQASQTVTSAYLILHQSNETPAKRRLPAWMEGPFETCTSMTVRVTGGAPVHVSGHTTSKQDDEMHPGHLLPLIRGFMPLRVFSCARHSTCEPWANQSSRRIYAYTFRHPYARKDTE